MSNYTGAVPESRRKKDWRDTAACRDDNTDRFFTTALVQEAKSVCFRCPAMLKCAQFALSTKEETGVWGGLSEGQRVTIHKKYRLHQLGDPNVVKTAVSRALAKELNPTETLRDVWEKYSYPLRNGHMGWSGPMGSFSFRGLPVTPKQVAFLVDRGHKAVGNVRSTCEVTSCVNPLHLADNEERRLRAAQELEASEAAEPTELSPCGTRAAYMRHWRNGEQACGPCLEANRLQSEETNPARSSSAA